MITTEQIKEAENRFSQASADLTAIKKAYAEQECPLKVGDIVEVCGYSYSGKKAVVKSICSTNSKYSSWSVIVAILKKDGTESKDISDFDQYQYNQWLNIRLE